jgi:hypothetical protein
MSAAGLYPRSEDLARQGPFIGAVGEMSAGAFV